MSLESYIHEKYRKEKQQLKQVVDAIHDVVLVFQRTAEVIPAEYCDDPNLTCDVTSWPYQIRADGLPTDPRSFSITTHGMILLLLEAIRIDATKSILIPERFVPPTVKFQDKSKSSLHAKLKDTLKSARTGVAASILAQPAKQHWLSKSKTYGVDDPLTITWYAEMALRWLDRVDDLQNEESVNRIFKACERTLKYPEATANDPKYFDLTTLEDTFRCHEIPHPFVRLRYLHLLKVLAKAGEKYPKIWKPATVNFKKLLVTYAKYAGAEWFERNLHQHLAYWGVHDPRFDPAQLAFSLEGLLQIGVDMLSPVTIGHVFDVLAAYQQRDPCWRPIVPFIATERGLALFPLSVEIANSILRSCELLDENNLTPHHFSNVEPQLSAYVSWLLARIERFHFQGEHVAGWHSDHVQERETIHLWQTSQVLLFMAHYASLLQRKIAADGLAAANITVKPHTSFPDLETFWNEEPLTIGPKTKATCYTVLKTIREKYVQPREEKKIGKLPCSFMLYGPPGTGKTTVAEMAAVRLKWPLIVITVSDFLAQGAPAMEARAKMIFTVLCEQQDSVILFDEIDQFLLDRSSGWYHAQDDVFKFMTPGMLTKLQDLRDASKCMFVVATNYYERIDGAIKRRGRIDDHFLLSLPDWKRRLYFIARFYLDESEKCVKECDDNGTTVSAIARRASEVEKVLKTKKATRTKYSEVIKFSGELEEELKKAGVHRATVLYGYSDLKKLVPSITKLGAGKTAKELAGEIMKNLGSVDASVELSAYRSRFCGPDGKLIGDETPTEEFCLLAYLYGEVGAPVESTLDKRSLKNSADSIKYNYEGLKALFELGRIEDFEDTANPDGHVYARVRDVLAQAATLK